MPDSVPAPVTTATAAVVVTTTKASPPWSFAGFSLQTYVSKNKGWIKTVLALLVGYANELLGTATDPNLNHLLSALVAGGSKMAFDWLDYYVSEVTTTSLNVSNQPPTQRL
jgi:hypothetical protein